jgi:high affinity sulfate transporter 1
MSIPILSWLPAYDRGFLRGDAIAGLTVWAVLVPEALAYATIAGVSPVVGLYAAPPALILYAVFGSSRHLVTGPMAATAALSAAAVANLAAANPNDFLALTSTLALVTGAVALLAGLLRLGFLASFISEPVLKGFIIGLALTIMAGQLPKLFGVKKGSGNFFQQLWDLVTSLGQTSGLTLLVGVASLVVVVGLRRVAPVVPGSLVAVLLGIAAVHLFHLDRHGVAIVGHIDSGLPSFGLPDVPAHRYFDLAPSAVGIMLVGFAEGLGAAKTYAAKHHYEIDVNQEFVALGTANIGSGLSSGMVVNGSLSKTAVNGSAGAKSQLSGLVVAGLTVVTLLFLTGLFEDLPEATLAAVVIAALVELIDVDSLVRYYRLNTQGLGGVYHIAARPDFTAALAALLGVLVFDTLPGLFIGISVSLLLLLYRASRPHVAVLGRVPGSPEVFADVERRPEKELVPGIVILRVEGGLFFADADGIRARVLAAVTDDTRAVVIDAETVPFIDLTAAEMLTGLAETLAERNVKLVIARELGAVRDMLGQLDSRAGAAVAFPTVAAAVDALSPASERDGLPSPSGDTA